MINKLTDVNFNEGGIGRLPKGAYMVEIKEVAVKENKMGQYLQIGVDINEGEYKNYFSIMGFGPTQYFIGIPTEKDQRENNGTFKKFRAFISSLQYENAGYRFNWDEDTMVGLKIGGVFRYEDFIKANGKVGTATKMAGFCRRRDINNNNYYQYEDIRLTKETAESNLCLPFEL